MNTTTKEKIRFSKAFWVANTVELFERAAYYGVFIVITLYLSRILGFNDIQAAGIAGVFSACLYLFPTFAGALADKIGFRNSMLIAFSLLTFGYLGLAVYPTWLQSAGLVQYGTTTTFTGLLESNLQYGIIPIMILIVCGGAFIKSVISGTVAKETTPETRAKGFSIFYAMVNIGAFSGKTIVKPLREALGNEGLITLNYFSASMTFLALLAIWFFYKSSQHSGEGKTFSQIWQALIKVCCNGRLIILILIITGFWMVQHQLYATMPKYVLRLAGEGASPSWYANVNPLVVVLTVNLVTQLMRKRTALMSMTIGFLEYFSLQAPKGEEGLYLGFSHLHSFLSSILGFGLSGFLLSKYCPEPTLFSTHEEWVAASAHAHYIWYYFGAIALVSAFALIIYGQVVKRLDTR